MNNLSVYKELQKESLFNEWTDELLKLNSLNGNDNYAVEIWNIAKDYAYNIATSVDPVGMFEFCRTELKNTYNGNSNIHRLKCYTCIGCVYTMIIKSADKAVVEQIKKNLPVSIFSYSDFQYNMNLQAKIYGIIDKINNDKLNDDYDYSKKKTRNKAAAKKVKTTDNGNTQALEKRIQELEKNKEELEKSKEELEEKLAAYEKGPIVVKPHNKVVLEVFVKLLEKSGADLKKHGNKANASRLAETITTLPLTTCQNYFSDRLKTTAHSDEVVKINILLKNLGIEWQL
ncbi:MAG: hypothetical protein SPE53_03575 [Prevotella sp.]|nr:hypothetical protein [Prevotella sp.]